MKKIINSENLRHYFGNYAGLVITIGVLVIFFGLVTDNFFSVLTFRTIANQMPDTLFVAVGMTFVLIIAGIDLSVGSVMGLCGAVTGALMAGAGFPLLAAVPIAILSGMICGMINGLVTVRWALPSFIVTLGMLEAARGGTYLVSGSRTAYIGSDIERLAEWNLFGLSLPFILALVVVVIGQFVLTRTIFGRYMIAIGTNEEAVRLSGVKAAPVKVAVFCISGMLAGMASISNVARLGAADPNAGTGFELTAIAAVVIGGTSLMGGRGSVVSTLFGVIIISVLENGLASMGAQEPTKRLVTGCVIVTAVILDYYRNRLRNV